MEAAEAMEDRLGSSDGVKELIASATNLTKALTATPAPSGGVRVPIAELLAIRDNLIKGDVDEAYHILYSVADPKFEKHNPWAEWEAFHTPEPPQGDAKT